MKMTVILDEIDATERHLKKVAKNAAVLARCSKDLGACWLGLGLGVKELAPSEGISFFPSDVPTMGTSLMEVTSNLAMQCSLDSFLPFPQHRRPSPATTTPPTP